MITHAYLESTQHEFQEGITHSVVLVVPRLTTSELRELLACFDDTGRMTITMEPSDQT